MSELKSQTSPSLAAHEILFLADISRAVKLINSSAFMRESSSGPSPFGEEYDETKAQSIPLEPV